MDITTDTVPIYTIGYGSRSMVEFIETLHQYNIAYLIDVRSVPHSGYKKEFSKKPLAKELEQHGIRYVFMGDLLGGKPDDESCYVNGMVDYEKVKRTELFQRGIERIHAAFSQQQSVALMCAEEKPEHCHRTKLVCATLTDQDLPIVHIDENNEPMTQEQIIDRITGGQMSLFGEETFHSRKKIPKTHIAQD
ncbi:DUF488 domain-containing protein [Candidatus Poribacteria bacterium]|nr:DUF488 domain-containing protein [Candidatus Poribacteria bacterium]